MDSSRVLTAVAMLASAGAAVAQPSTPNLKFDVASLKARRGDIQMMRGPFIVGRTVRSEASTLLDFVTFAYSLRYDQLSGAPAWASDEHYDLDAKADGSGVLPAGDARLMMRALLAERFRLQAHSETLEAPVYLLEIGKGEPKLKPVAEDTKGGAIIRGVDKGMLRMETTKSTMAQLVNQLSFTAGRPVLDRTGLSGPFAFTLEWFPANRPAPADADVPTMGSALQDQLGLRLVQGKAPAERIIIDHVEKASDN